MLPKLCLIFTKFSVDHHWTKVRHYDVVLWLGLVFHTLRVYAVILRWDDVGMRHLEDLGICYLAIQLKTDKISTSSVVGSLRHIDFGIRRCSDVEFWSCNQISTSKDQSGPKIRNKMKVLEGCSGVNCPSELISSWPMVSPATQPVKLLAGGFKT